MVAATLAARARARRPPAWRRMRGCPSCARRRTARCCACSLRSSCTTWCAILIFGHVTHPGRHANETACTTTGMKCGRRGHREVPPGCRACEPLVHEATGALFGLVLWGSQGCLRFAWPRFGVGLLVYTRLTLAAARRAAEHRVHAVQAARGAAHQRRPAPAAAPVRRRRRRAALAAVRTQPSLSPGSASAVSVCCVCNRRVVSVCMTAAGKGCAHRAQSGQWREPACVLVHSRCT